MFFLCARGSCVIPTTDLDQDYEVFLGLPRRSRMRDERADRECIGIDYYDDDQVDAPAFDLYGTVYPVGIFERQDPRRLHFVLMEQYNEDWRRI